MRGDISLVHESLDTSPFKRMVRLQNFFRVMSRPQQDDILVTAEDVCHEQLLDEALSTQLHSEIHATMRTPDGATGSLLYQLLPQEVRMMVWKHVVVVPEHIHVFAPYDNDDHGYRLSRCGDHGVDEDYGRCKCENGRPFVGAVAGEYLDTALLLVCKSVRREALDVLFTQNHFTFTNMRDLNQFTACFRTSASKIQHIRVYERADDYPCTDFRAKQIQKTRQRIGSLQSLELRIYLCDWTSYEEVHEDAFLNEFVHLAFPRPTVFECEVRYPGRVISRRSSEEADRSKRVAERLINIFTGVYGDKVEDVPFSAAPPLKIREDDKPLSCRKGIMALRD